MRIRSPLLLSSCAPMARRGQCGRGLCHHPTPSSGRPCAGHNLNTPSAGTPTWVLTRITSTCSINHSPVTCMTKIWLNNKLFVETAPASAIKLFGRDIKNAGTRFPLGHWLSIYLDEILLLRPWGKGLYFSSWQQSSAFVFQISGKKISNVKMCVTL